MGMLLLLSGMAMPQDPVGLPFLKIGTGARQAGMGGVFTGVGDDVYTIFTNPGGLGHIRRWQWSADYNVWFTDVYQATLSAVGQFRFLGSRKASLGIHASYIGMPEWDATGGMDTPVTANHATGGVSLAQRLDWISKMLAVGVNLRGFSSFLGDYAARGWFADAGLMIRPPRFSMGAGRGLFDYGIITAGASLMHIGEGVTFLARPTALPRTWRAGLSLHMGRHNGWSLLMAADAIGVLDREMETAFGAEIWWRSMVALRAGYRINQENLGDFSLGIGMRWDDVMNSILGLPSRFGDAFEVAVAGVDYGSVLNQTYRGSFSHFPVAPEPFRLDEPLIADSQVLGESSAVTLSWEKATDPDPFDRVQYLVMVAPHKGMVDRSIQMVERDLERFFRSALRDSLLICESVAGTRYQSKIREGGIYYWAVAAYDLDGHARLARRGEERIADFVVSTPDLNVRAFSFEPRPLITTTSEQGRLTLQIANEGNIPSGPFRVRWTDRLPDICAEDSSEVLMDVMVSNLPSGSDTTFILDWHTSCNGIHSMEVKVDADNQVKELVKENNNWTGGVVSIPKGRVTSLDSAEIIATDYDYIEMPIVPKVYFQPFSEEVHLSYIEDRGIYPAVLKAFAERLRAYSHVTMRIMGSIDYLTGEQDPLLAERRAERVRDHLRNLGVDDSQLVVVKNHPQTIRGRRPMPSDSLDAKWMMEQNRVVTFSVDRAYEELIFRPFRIAADTTFQNGGIPFHVELYSPGGIEIWRIKGESVPFEIIDMNLIHGDSLRGKVSWNGMDQNGLLVLKDNSYRYRLVLTDSLGRTFYTPMDSVFVKERRTLQRWEMFGAAEFAGVEPVYQFYWDHLMDIAREMVENPAMSVQFDGHACAIGSETVNERLSLRRAQRFTEAFKERVRRAYPNQYMKIWNRIEPPRGFGENEPLRITIQGRGDLLLGDNDSPIGRYLNRRIMVLLYKEN